MTASELTPVEGESHDGGVQYNDYLATVLCAELERASGALYTDFYTVAEDWNNEGEPPVQEDIETLERRITEAQYALRLLKELRLNNE
jgi:hypothetical protein